jgi:hypothetical protein
VAIKEMVRHARPAPGDARAAARYRAPAAGAARPPPAPRARRPLACAPGPSPLTRTPLFQTNPYKPPFQEREYVTKYAESEIINHSCLRHPHVVCFREVFLSRGHINM